MEITVLQILFVCAVFIFVGDYIKDHGKHELTRDIGTYMMINSIVYFIYYILKEIRYILCCFGVF